MAIKLFVQKGGEEPRELDFEGPVVLIGRGETNDLVVDDVRSSRKHCSVSETPQGAVLEDLGSSNGTSYNGEPVKRTLLESGDKFAIGSTSFYYDKCPVSSPPEPVAEQPGSRTDAGENLPSADDLLLEVEAAEAPPEPLGLAPADDYWSRLVASEENPGWLWDPVEEEWVADPENPPEGGE